MENLSTTLILFLFLFFQSCSEKDKECNGVCTEEYRTIVVSIEDSDGNPVALDSFKVVELENNRDLTIQPDDNMFQEGYYPIFSDRYAKEYIQQQLEIRLTGFIEGEEVVNEVYKVGADCCHVYHVSGELELVL